MIATMPESGAIVATAVEGDDATSAIVELYYVELGAEVHAGDPLALLRTDRYVYDLPAGDDGAVRAFLANAGEAVALGTPLVRLEPLGTVAETPAIVDTAPATVRRATPLARRIAAAHGYALETIAGTGRGGLIRAADVRGLVPLTNDQRPATNDQRRSANDRGRMTPGGCLDQRNCVSSASQTDGVVAATLRDLPVAAGAIERSVEPRRDGGVPRALTAFEVDVESILHVAPAEAPRLRRRDVEVTPMVRIAAAAVRALLEHRMLNSRWTVDGMLLYGDVHLGFWTQTERGPVEAIIPRAAELNARGLAKALAPGKSAPAVSGKPTFAIVDASQAGGMWRQPELPLECGAILGIGAMSRRIVAGSSDGAAVAVRRRCVLTLAYDARYLSQSDADRYLARVRALVEARHGM